MSVGVAVGLHSDGRLAITLIITIFIIIFLLNFETIPVCWLAGNTPRLKLSHLGLIPYENFSDSLVSVISHLLQFYSVSSRSHPDLDVWFKNVNIQLFCSLKDDYCLSLVNQ